MLSFGELLSFVTLIGIAGRLKHYISDTGRLILHEEASGKANTDPRIKPQAALQGSSLKSTLQIVCGALSA